MTMERNMRITSIYLRNTRRRDSKITFHQLMDWWVSNLHFWRRNSVPSCHQKKKQRIAKKKKQRIWMINNCKNLHPAYLILIIALKPTLELLITMVMTTTMRRHKHFNNRANIDIHNLLLDYMIHNIFWILALTCIQISKRYKIKYIIDIDHLIMIASATTSKDIQFQTWSTLANIVKKDIVQ